MIIENFKNNREIIRENAFKHKKKKCVLQTLLRDGPLENLWGGGGGGEVQKKYWREGKLNEKKFMHAN